MQSLNQLGEAVAQRRHALGVKQGQVAEKAGITQESLSRFERGRAAEFGARKLLAVLAVLGMEIRFSETAPSLHARTEQVD
ncbi:MULTISPECIES: helix-turn-helix domain-containing protein [Pseudomonadaceae]|uniref:helix-turn-helix domain-containing protein n=1 Tax=Pseudomonadaceae TaxID=135621 RepID=UPI0009A290D2|nr:helix-turn-helix transcriptional regulator [Pseudomonas aeruginosa]MBG4066898.1 helix-turn-helix transcriptional regulator [Pseudomonas aeruginosa]MBG5599856.1 helix-turn-helix transcriptional regulator [Pseudomonas aeruginosa]MBH3671866.1 helix-turn-helix transcriptional regulator [Pseudomonas aeruginosa]MBH9432947.1 helix-turn-helix transcriptional regulator [Pseudomonas aeruginosa]